MPQRHGSRRIAEGERASVGSAPSSPAMEEAAPPAAKHPINVEYLTALNCHRPSLMFMKDENGRYVCMNRGCSAVQRGHASR